jgi:hypothetical protein
VELAAAQVQMDVTLSSLTEKRFCRLRLRMKMTVRKADPFGWLLQGEFEKVRLLNFPLCFCPHIHMYIYQLTNRWTDFYEIDIQIIYKAYSTHAEEEEWV